MGWFGDRDDEQQPSTPVDPLQAIDRAAVPPHLLPVVDRAIASAHQMRNLAWSRAEGPVQARLFGVARRVDSVAISVYETALRAAHLDAVAATLDPEAVTARYKELKRRPDADPELVASLRARFESVQRILNARDSIDGDLQLLEARLEAAVARGAELLLDPTGEVDTNDVELTALDDELTALRAALDEVSALQAPPSTSPPFA